MIPGMVGGAKLDSVFSPQKFEFCWDARMVDVVMRELIDSIGGNATGIVIVLTMAGSIVGLVTYIIRRVVRRIDIMTVHVDELRSARARAESDRAYNENERQVASKGDSDLDRSFDAFGESLANLARLHGEMLRDMEEIREGLRKIRDRMDEDEKFFAKMEKAM